MHLRRASLVVVAIVSLSIFLPRFAVAQYQPPSERLTITSDRAVTWNDGQTVIVQSDSPVSIETDRAKMTARSAVIWLSPVRGAVLEQQTATIVLIGDATLDQPQQQIQRSGSELVVTTQVRGSVRIVAEQRVAENRSDSELYRQANRIRPLATAPAEPGELIQRPWLETPPPMPPPLQLNPTTRPREPVHFRATHVDTTTTPEGKTAFILSGGATITQRRANGDLIELQAERAVLFTQLRGLGDADRAQSAEDAVESAYLEGDVRIGFTPAGSGRPEQRLQASRVFYEFSTDRAILTQAVVHTFDPQRNLPITVRANIVRQLSVGEFRAEKVELSTSNFRTPTYSLRADRAYIRQEDTGDARLGNRTTFSTRDSTLHLFGAPIFWLPVMGGSVTDRGVPLRSVFLESSNRFGFGVRTEWGLFESLGRLPPRELDVSYNLDWFAKRGPGIGLNADYQGGYIDQTTREPWDFKGEFTTYWLPNDHGEDRFGSSRATIQPEDDFRGRLLWEHQHFFSDDWQAQVRLGYVTDPSFLEQFFEREFDTRLPHEFSAYLKRQEQTEALTLTVVYPTNDFTTTANQLQEQVQIERMPEIGYHRIGDSFGNDDQFTFLSGNRVGLLRFRESDATLLEQGFRPGQSPGIPSYATTGTDDRTNLRGDFRQEIDYPFSMGQFRVVPYFVGRYTGYTDSPGANARDRFFVGTGVRMHTAFWKVDESARSKLFDVYRLRHVVEPEMNVFTSAQTRDQTDFFIYDEQVDAINDITALQLALRQRWQTKRGGPGRLRSVDFLTLNVEGNFFTNQPDDDTILAPKAFRGLFFPSLPESSLARNGINADILWRVSDSTAVLADAQYNLDEGVLATTSIGVAVQRDPRLSYFLGTRYIGEINSTIASVAANYQLSAKYQLAFSQSFNLSDQRNENSSVTVIRRFDRLFLTMTAYYDQVNDESGFNFGLIPEGLGAGLSSGQLNRVFGE